MFDVTLLEPETAMNVVLWLDVIRAAAMAVAGVVMLARLARSHGSERRMLAPVLLAGAASMVSAAYTAQYAMQTLGFIPVVDNETIVPIAWVFNVIRVVVPLTILYGVLQLRGARSAMAGAVADVGNAPTASALRDALATALGDRDLQILAWDHARRDVPATDGTAVPDDELQRLEHQPDRRAVRVDADGDPLAVIVVARAVAEDPALLGAGVSLTRLVVRNEQQAARIQEQLVDVRASPGPDRRGGGCRAPADRARPPRRAPAADGRARDAAPGGRRVRGARRGAHGGQRGDPRDPRGCARLARGIHPAVLTEAGLAAAIRAAADRSPVPAEVDIRLTGVGSPAAQATAYYVVSESLANVAKHAAAASAVWIEADDGAGRIRVVVEDDGPGGADATGHGLAGLADRVAALDGRFSVGARNGGGTRVVAEVPVA